jgi:hypothetical protein
MRGEPSWPGLQATPARSCAQGQCDSSRARQPVPRRRGAISTYLHDIMVDLQEILEMKLEEAPVQLSATWRCLWRCS